MQQSQFELYDKIYTDVRVLPEHVRSLGATRQFLTQLYRCSGEKIVLMDDDLEFYWRKDPKNWHLTTPSPEALEQMFSEVETALDTYAHIGLSGREGQNREMSYSVENTRYMRFLAYNLALWPEGIICDRLDGMSDFDTNLQLLRAGLPNLVFFRWAQGHRSTHQPGGMAGQRTHDTHTAEVLALCELHAGLVVPTQKHNRTGGDFGARDEVRVSWAQAVGWNQRANRIITPLERMSMQLNEARLKIRNLELELGSYKNCTDFSWSEVQCTS